MNIVIIGGGMSGLTTAITAKKNPNNNVTVIEQNSRVGKKIAQTGNGRCNITNLDIDAKYYNTEKIESFLLGSNEKVAKFLDDIGLLTCPDENNRVYPITQNANSVVDCLRSKCDILQIKVVTDTLVIGITNTKNGYLVETNNGEFVADKLVLSMGSKIACKSFNATNIVDKSLFTPLKPSLTPLTVSSPYKYLNGIRARAKVTLKVDGVNTYSESGEVLFKEYGLSGISIFNISSYIARNSVKKVNAKYIVSIDLFESMDYNTLLAELKKRYANYVDDERFFYGLLNNKIALAVLDRANVTKINNHSLDKIAKVIKSFDFVVVDTLDYSMAQVMSGGISLNNVDNHLKIKNTNIFVTGELLDVDGICGGYNLHWAILSGLIVGENL